MVKKLDKKPSMYKYLSLSILSSPLFPILSSYLLFLPHTEIFLTWHTQPTFSHISTSQLTLLIFSHFTFSSLQFLTQISTHLCTISHFHLSLKFNNPFFFIHCALYLIILLVRFSPFITLSYSLFYPFLLFTLSFIPRFHPSIIFFSILSPSYSSSYLCPLFPPLFYFPFNEKFEKSVIFKKCT